MSDNILLKYNVDTTRMKVAVGNENIVVALKNSADKQDFAYIKPYCEDSLIVRLHTGKDNIQSHTDKEKAIFFLNSIFSVPFSGATYKIFKNVDNIEQGNYVYILEFDNLVNENGKLATIRILMVMEKNKINTIQLY